VEKNYLEMLGRPADEVLGHDLRHVLGAELHGRIEPAIAAARNLAAELELTERAKFIEADLYEAPNALSEPGSFDLVQRIICFQSTTTPTKCSVGRPNRIKPALETSDTVH